MSNIHKFSSLRLMITCLVFSCGMAGAGGIVHVADESANQVFFFDSNTNLWSLGNGYLGGAVPAYIAITPNGKFSYTTSVISRAVVVNNIFAGFPFQVAAIPVAGAASGAAPVHIDISPDGSLAYVAVRHLSVNTLNHVMVINAVTHTAVTTVDTGVGLGDKVNAVNFTPNGQQVWVGHDREGSIEVIDVATNTLLTGSSYPILSGAGPADIAFTPDGNFAYVTNSGFDNATGFDVDTVTVIDTSIPGGIKVLSVGSKPLGIAMSPDGNYAYVANSGSGPGSPIHAVSVIATGGSTCAEPAESPPCVLTTVAVGVNPQDVAFTEDGLFAYVSNRNSKNVSVISTATHTLVATVPIIAASNLAGIAIAPPPDADSDGVEDSLDNCKNIPNPGQENHDGDSLGDVCDPDDDNDGQTDDDENACGSNPKDINDLSPDFDGDESPDCVDPDDDNDGQTDDDEIACGSNDKDINDLSPDNDNDDTPDCVDPDDDNDGVNDDVPDNCPFNHNPLQVDSDGDQIGNVCDPDFSGDALITAAAGGPVETGNGDVQVFFDPNDLAADTEIFIAPFDSPVNVNLDVSQPRQSERLIPQSGGAPAVFDLGQLIIAYNFTPGGLNFNSEVILTMAHDVTALHPTQRAAVDIYVRQAQGRFLPMGANCDISEGPPASFTVSCNVDISHFSIYAMVAPRDTDGDGAFDRFEGFEDNCPNDFNPGQRDIYGNGIGDVCDPEYIFYDHFEGTNLE